MDKDVFKKMQIDYKLLEIKQKTKKILILLLLLFFGIFIILALGAFGDAKETLLFPLQ